VALLDDAQRLACLRLIRSENVGPVTFRELINHFGGAEAALEALPELSRRGGRGRPIRVCSRAQAEAEMAAAAAFSARPLFTIEPGYPVPLAHLPAPPPMIYVRGREELLARDAVAIVGARNGSAAGISMTRQLARTLGAAGYVVVSGLARGIDGAAHEAALATGTVAVLAGGIDHVYPLEHADLCQRIASEGCLVAEQPPGFQPRGQDFPRRNRIISGMVLGVVIVEAARRSGSLITARTAAEQGREVMAVPGHPLDPRAEGTNGLIKGGATLVRSAEDVLEVLAPMAMSAGGHRGDGPPAVFPASGRDAEPASSGGNRTYALEGRELVVAALGPAPVSIDALAQATGLPMQAVRVALLELALAGRLEQHGNQLVSLSAHPGRQGSD
jgi:DNA processing protein